MLVIFLLFRFVLSRDLRLHKLVFEEDVLADGTALAYFARGEVITCIDKLVFSALVLCMFMQISYAIFKVIFCLIIQLLWWLAENFGGL